MGLQVIECTYCGLPMDEGEMCDCGRHHIECHEKEKRG